MVMSECTGSNIEHATRAGATLLDQHMPGWELHTNLNTLDMHRHGLCLLSQLFGSYEEGIQELHIGPLLIEADLNTIDWESYGSEYGFTISPLTPIEATKEAFTQLTSVWKKIIVQRTCNQLTAHSRYIEVRYDTPRGYATPHFHPGEEEELERKLVSLKRRHITATVTNLLTGEIVGGTGEGLFNNNAASCISRWNYWYCPEGIDAKGQPANSRKIVCDLSRL